MLRRFLAVVVGIMVCINLLWIPPVQGAVDYSIVRVRLSSLGAPKSVNITVDGHYGIPQIDKNNVLTKGSYTVRIQSGKLVLDDKTGSKTVSTTLGSSFTFKRYQGSEPNRLKIGSYYYLGDMEVRLDGGSIQLVNHIHLETYLYGVVPYEVSNSWPIEVQKAQAVAARTYAVSNMGKSNYFDVHDTEMSQVYRGYNSSHTNSIKAVNDTFGQVLKYGNGFAGTYYSSSNGGMIESTENLWGSKLAYSQVKPDEYDIKNQANPNRSWEVTYSKKSVNSALLTRLDFKGALAKQGLKESDIENLEIKSMDFKYNSSNRADSGTIVFTMNKKSDGQEPEGEPTEPEVVTISFSLNKGNIRSILGLKSLLFKVVDNGDKFVLQGSGYGHGIGMSQYGAQQMAKEGKSYKDILAFYYPNTNLTTLSISKDKGGDPKPQNPSDPKPDPDPDPGSDPNPGSGKEPQYARVNVSSSTNLNLRQGPGTNYKIIGKLSRGTRVEVLDRSGAWYKIKTGSTQGYVHGDYIVLEDDTPPPTQGQDPKPNVPEDPAPPPADDRRYGTVTVSALNVRSGPSTKNHKVGMVTKGTKLTIVESQNGWYKIIFNGKDAYVHGDYVKLDSTSNPAPSQPSPGTVIGKATVNCSVLNVRSGAGTGYKKIGSLTRNQQVELLEKTGSWYKIKYGSGTGYVHGDYLKLNNTSNPAPTQPSPGTVIGKATVNCSVLNVRSGAGTGYKKIGSLTRNQQVELLEKTGSWYKIKYGSGTGYVHGDYLKMASSGESNRGTQQRTGVVDASALNVRTGPGTNYSRVGLLYRGAKVTIVGESGGWYKIQSGSVTGYVSKTYIK